MHKDRTNRGVQGTPDTAVVVESTEWGRDCWVGMEKQGDDGMNGKWGIVRRRFWKAYDGQARTGNSVGRRRGWGELVGTEPVVARDRLHHDGPVLVRGLAGAFRTGRGYLVGRSSEHSA